MERLIFYRIPVINKSISTLKFNAGVYQRDGKCIFIFIYINNSGDIKMNNFTRESIKAFDYNSAIKFIINLNKIYQYSRIRDNRVELYDPKIIDLAWTNLMNIEKQPEVFPEIAAIQFEWSKENDDYLQIEIYADRIKLFSVINEEKFENILSIDADLNLIINEFFGKFSLSEA